METKFLKYWKTIPPLFSLDACMDPRVKVEGVENILNYIACCMNQPHEPEGHIYEQLNNYINITKINMIVPLQMLQLHLHLEMILFLCN